MSTDTTPVVILGAGGHARVILEALRTLGVPVAGFIAPSAEGSRLGDVPWLGDDTALSGLGDGTEAVNGVGSAGSAARRAAVHAAAEAAGLRFRTIIHPNATVDGSAELGAGAQVLAGSVVGVAALIGADAIVNSGAIVDHDSVVGAHSHIASGAALAGDVTVGESTHVGLGSRVIQGVTIGSSCVIGAGAVVLDDVADGTTVVGVPARPPSTKARG
jgi:UDP-perosamine 4-acetyltransferase